MSYKLREAAQAVLKSTKSLAVCCENFNHRRQDFHDDGECPPWRRYNDALAELEAALAEPEQEPVAWMRPSEEGYDSSFRDHATVVMCTGNKWEGWVPLYTQPPSRKWVGLTGEDISQWIEEEHDVLRWAEAKLREKNT